MAAVVHALHSTASRIRERVDVKTSVLRLIICIHVWFLPLYHCCISVAKTNVQLPNLTIAICYLLLTIQAIVDNYVARHVRLMLCMVNQQVDLAQVHAHSEKSVN